MDFQKILKLIIKSFGKEKIKYAVIGGFGMGILGVSHSTIDLDFLIQKEDQPSVAALMKKLGYKRVYQSEDVSQFVNPLNLFGEVDFLHAFRETSKNMLSRALTKKMYDGQLKIKVLRPEDIIGLKIQAFINNKKRELQDYTDIDELISFHREKLDWNILKEYFNLFGLKKKFIKYKKEYGIHSK